MDALHGQEAAFSYGYYTTGSRLWQWRFTLPRR